MNQFKAKLTDEKGKTYEVTIDSDKLHTWIENVEAKGGFTIDSIEFIGKPEVARFEPGRVYCDSESWFYFKVIKRTEKNVWILKVNSEGKPYRSESVRRRKIKVWSDAEYCDTDGQYSMAPTLDAKRVA